MANPNTGIQHPESAPQKVSAVPGLGKKIMSALAALGIAASAEKVEAATILPHTTPTLQPGASSNILHTTTISGVDLRINTPATGAGRGIENVPYQGTSRISVTMPSNTDGILTISWDAKLGTGSAPGGLSALGFTGATFNVDQRARLGLNGGSMNEINFFNGPEVVNGPDQASGISTTEGYNLSQSFSSQNINVLKGQTFNLDFEHTGVNANTFSEIANLKFSFEGIPEPSTTALVGGGAAALLLRRRRKEQETEKSES